MRYIEDFTFSGCRSLEEVTVQEGVKHIGEFAFYECSNLQMVRFFKYGPIVRSTAFYTCKKLKRVIYSGKQYFLAKVKDDDDTPATVWEIADSLRPRKVVPYDSQPFPAGYPYMDEFEYLNSGGED